MGIYEAHKRDLNPLKVDLTVGAYRDADGRPYVLKSVLKAEQNIVDKMLSKEESEWNGSKLFRECTFRLAVGEKLSHLDHVMTQVSIHTLLSAINCISIMCACVCSACLTALFQNGENRANDLL